MTNTANHTSDLIMWGLIEMADNVVLFECGMKTNSNDWHLTYAMADGIKHPYHLLQIFIILN
jgi:hypothetical protein